MGLAERIAAGAPKPQPKLDKLVAQELTEADRSALVAAALDPEWSDEALARVLQDEGFVIGPSALASWRAIKREEAEAAPVVPVDAPVVEEAPIGPAG